MRHFATWVILGIGGVSCVANVGSVADAGTLPGGDGGRVAAADSGSPIVDSGAASDAGPALTTFATSATDHGVTWTFSKAVPVGQFVNGDYYVIGAVTITAISPAPQNVAPYMNGSVKNLPTANGHSAFDQRLNDGVDQSSFFDATFRMYPPFDLQPGDALVSAVSLAQPHTLPEPFGGSGAVNNSPIQSMSVLTVLAAAPASEGAFRPSYCDRSQTLYNSNALRRNLLPSLAPPAGTQIPPLSRYAPMLARPWIDVTFFLWDVPGEYMASYSQHFTFVTEYAALLLTLNFPADQKVALTNGLVQRGIDAYGCVKAGVKWPAFGGYGHGRKLPILLAGELLNEPAMSQVSADYPDSFGEDMQTVYVNRIPGGYTQAWQGATVIYGGHLGVKTDGTPRDPNAFNGQAGPYEQLQPQNWPLLSPTEQLGEAYRRCCTSNVFVGEALAAQLLGLKTTWNYPAFFDYADRWMRESDTQAIADIKTQSGFDYSQSWERQQQTASFLQGLVPEYDFIDGMWTTYR